VSDLRARLTAYLTPPAHLSRAEQRNYVVYSLTMPASAVLHLMLVVIFLLIDIPVMALFNVLSAMIWLGGAMLTRSGRQEFGLIIAIVEVVFHSALAVNIAGWDLGFQYFLFAAASGTSLIPRRRWLKVMLIIALIATYIALSFQAGNPTIVQNPIVVHAISIFNILFSFSMIATLAIYTVDVSIHLDTQLEDAHAVSEGLLHNILPDVIVRRLKQSSDTIADGFESCTVLFADIANFTPLSQSMTPAQVVQMLDDLFSRFDELVRRYGLEKIKTIGDCYMVAAGVPIPRDDHAQVMTAFALEMRRIIDDYNGASGRHLQMRIGMHSGPVVAGVIGKVRFLYDLWGDSVNTASRMESHGVPGEIQVTEETRRLLGETYQFEDRGMIEVKGKGLMRTYFLREMALAEGTLPSGMLAAIPPV
jgi:adenylate cyclase